MPDNLGTQCTTLWAQLLELESRGSTDQLEKARIVRDICDQEKLGLREFAKRAKTDWQLDGLGAAAPVSRLLAWSQLVELAHDRGVLPRGNTPAEGTLRPLFQQRVPAQARLELLAAAAETAPTITATNLRKIINDRYPPAPRVSVPARGAKRQTIKPLRDLISKYGLEAVRAGFFHLEAEEQRRQLREGKTNGD